MSHQYLLLSLPKTVIITVLYLNMYSNVYRLSQLLVDNLKCKLKTNSGASIGYCKCYI